MRLIIFLIIILSLVGITGFSFLAMGHDGSHNSCLAAILENMGFCPGKSGFLEFAALHIGFLKRFSGVILSNLLISALAIIFFVVFQFYKKDNDTRTRCLFCLYQEIINFRPPIKIKFDHWFSLLEKSPVFELGRQV